MLRPSTVFLALLLVFAAGFALPVQESASAQSAGPAFSGVLPMAHGQSVSVSQGNDQGDHVGLQQYAFDFVDGRSNFVIAAAQAGTVIGLNDTSNIQCSGLSQESVPVNRQLLRCWAHANFVLIRDDGGTTATLYMHLLQGSTCTAQFCVTVGEHVSQGQPLASAGTTGWSTGVHLHFQAETPPAPQQDPYSGWWFTNSLPAQFTNPEVKAQDSDGVPKAGQVFQLGAGTSPTQAVPAPTGPNYWANRSYVVDCPGIAPQPFSVFVHQGAGHGAPQNGFPQGFDVGVGGTDGFAAGDLTGDGQPEVAVVVGCHPTGTSPGYATNEVQIFTGGAKGPKMLARLTPPFPASGLGNFPPVFGGYNPVFKVSSGNLITSIEAWAPGDCHACASIFRTVTWHWNGRRFEPSIS